jgi:hypothetical protein
VRTLEIFRLGYGLAQFAFPTTVTRLTSSKEEHGVIVATRVLGVRDVVQAFATANASRPVARIGGIVDGLHATTAVVFAIAHPTARRQALVSAAVATLFCVGELRR